MRLTLVCLTVLIFISCNKQEEETVSKIRPVKHAKASLSDGSEYNTFSGVVKAERETALSFKVGGTLSSLRINLGDEVRKGQLIATIDATDYQIQEQQAQSQKEGSTANLQSAEANAKAAETQLINAQSTYDRIEKLYANNSVSLSEYQQAKAGLDAAKASYDAANSQVKAAETQVSASSQQVQAANNQSAYTKLVSPISGVITAIGADENEVVGSGRMIATVSSIGRPEVEVGVPELFINKIEKGQKVTITMPSLPQQVLEGSVYKVAYSAGSAPTYPVYAKLYGGAKDVRPGMAANVRFEISKNASSIESVIAPVEAVGKDGDGNFVFVLKPSEDEIYVSEQRRVEVGGLFPGGFEIKSGLMKDEIVATAGLKTLFDGTKVRLLNE